MRHDFKSLGELSAHISEPRQIFLQQILTSQLLAVIEVVDTLPHQQMRHVDTWLGPRPQKVPRHTESEASWQLFPGVQAFAKDVCDDVVHFWAR